MVLGATVVAAFDACEGVRARHLLFVDADLAASVRNAAPLIEPVRARAADMTIGLLPAQPVRGGGRGHVVRLAWRGIHALTGARPAQPLSGQRCLSREAFDAARPLAHGFGVETGLTIDLMRKGYRVVELPLDVRHRVTGASVAGQLHRAIQYVDVARALAVRTLPDAVVHPRGHRVRVGRL